MTNEPSDLRRANLKIRVSFSEYDFIKDLADKSCMSISNYGRYKLLEDTEISPIIAKPKCPIDNKSKFACDHDREIMCILMREFLFVKELARKGLEPKLFEKCNEQALHMLRKWGYEQ